MISQLGKQLDAFGELLEIPQQNPSDPQWWDSLQEQGAVIAGMLYQLDSKVKREDVRRARDGWIAFTSALPKIRARYSGPANELECLSVMLFLLDDVLESFQH
jgi:hypothetical protein